MTVMQSGGGRGPSPTGLADVIETILDKGMVIDAYVRVSLVGIEVLTIDARVVIASVDTYLRFAEAVNRLDISQEKQGLADLVGPGAGKAMESGAKRKTKGKLDAATDKLRNLADNGERERPAPGAAAGRSVPHRSRLDSAGQARCLIEPVGAGLAGAGQRLNAGSARRGVAGRVWRSWQVDS